MGMGTVVGEESLFTVYLLMLSDGWTIYTYRLIFFLIDENQTNLWWRSLATFRHIEKTARRAERFTCPQIPTASGPEPTPILRCHPSHRGLSPQSLSQYYWEVYCPQCLQHKKHFFFFIGSLQKAFWLFPHFGHEHFILKWNPKANLQLLYDKNLSNDWVHLLQSQNTWVQISVVHLLVAYLLEVICI